MKTNNPIYADLSCYNPKETIPFYETVFGWEFYKDEGYYTAYLGDTPVIGLYETPSLFKQMQMPHFWMTYIQVNDVTKTVELGQKLGGIIEVTEKESAWSTSDDSLDDMYAALANFVFRMAAAGTITKYENHYLITVNTVMIYVRDSFDYNDSGVIGTLMSQPLGYWNIEKNMVTTKNKNGYRYINNESYQDYRSEMGVGGDFLVYSNLKKIIVNDTFKVPLTSF